jgi:hypothetical protein
MVVDLDTERLKALAKGFGRGLLLIARQNDASNVKPEAAEGINQTQNVLIIGNAEVASDLVFLNIGGIDGDDDLCRILELNKHFDLTVGRKAGQDTRGVKIVKELAAELKIQLSAEGVDAFSDMLGLHTDIFVVIESDPAHFHRPFAVSKYGYSIAYLLLFFNRILRFSQNYL